MNIIEMQDLCDLLLDKANSPWFSSAEKDKFINLAQAEFSESRYRQFEFDERTRKELISLVRRSIGTNVSTINLDLIQDYMFTLNLSGVFNKTCGTGTTTEAIKPLQLDDEFDSQNDPFNKNDDSNPAYTEENNGTNNVVLIISDNAPISYVLKYLKRPIDVFRDTQNPLNNISSEMPIFTHEEIVNIAVRKMMATTEQQLNYQLHNNEIQNEN